MPAAETTAATFEAWRQAAAASLRGTDPSTLATRTADGIVIEPVYAPAPEARPIAGRPPGGRWRIVQRIDHPDPAAARAQALADLEGGADGLALVLAGAASARGFGLPADAKAIAAALEGVHPGLVTLRLEAGADPVPAAQALARFAQGDDGADLRLGWDGGARLPQPAFAALLALGPNARLTAADGRPAQAAGATPALELAAALAGGVAALRRMEAAGLTLAAAQARLDVALAADVDVLLSLAKVRAMRRLWARVAALAGLPLADAPPVHVETAASMLATRDPWTNALRTTLAAVAAGLGGADSVTVLPHTAASGLPGAFERRVARNAQHVLMDEAGLHRLADPVAGAGALEALTGALCRAAWATFRSVEAVGGAESRAGADLIDEACSAAKAARPAPAFADPAPSAGGGAA